MKSIPNTASRAASSTAARLKVLEQVATLLTPDTTEHEPELCARCDAVCDWRDDCHNDPDAVCDLCAQTLLEEARALLATVSVPAKGKGR